MSIDRIIIAAVNRESDEITYPPERILDLEVTDGVATLVTRDSAEDDADHVIEVPALSLKRALEAAIEDDNSPRARRLGGEQDVRPFAYSEHDNGPCHFCGANTSIESSPTNEKIKVRVHTATGKVDCYG